jgi:hypothetical protein
VRVDVGGVIRRVFDIYVDQAPVLMPAAAAVFVLVGIVSSLLAQSGSVLGALVGLVLTLVATMLFTAMVVELVADVQDGRRDATPSQLLRAATPVLGQLIVVGLVAGIGIVVGFVLLIVPGLILLTIWAVIAPVIVLERPPGLAALSRSRELVRGNGWQVFGVLIVLTVAIAIVSIGIEAAAESAGTGAGIVARVVVGVLTAPISSLAAAVLYFDLLKASGSVPSRPAAARPDPFGGP